MILDETGHESGDPRGAAEPDIDPNYDPAFQRGYRPKPGEQLTVRAREPVSAVDSPALRRPIDEHIPAVMPVAPTASEPAAETETETETETEAETETEPATVTAASPAGSILDDVDISPRRNPYFLALWILGGGFVVLGIVLYAYSVYTSYTTSSVESDLTTLVFSQIGWMLAGPLVTVGLATIVSLVVLAALRSRSD